MTVVAHNNNNTGSRGFLFYAEWLGKSTGLTLLVHGIISLTTVIFIINGIFSIIFSVMVLGIEFGFSSKNERVKGFISFFSRPLTKGVFYVLLCLPLFIFVSIPGGVMSVLTCIAYLGGVWKREDNGEGMNSIATARQAKQVAAQIV